MSEKVLLDKVRRAPLRSPQSYPGLFDAAGIGTERGTRPIQGNSKKNMENQNSFAGDSSAQVMNSDLCGNIKTAPTKERKPRVTLDNILSVGYDPEFFNTIKPVSRPTSCHNCGLHGSRRCSQCHQTYYCSVECQKQDWKAHSVFCKPAMPKGPNGDKSPSGDAKPYPKPKACPVPDFRNDQGNGRKIMLRDLQEETLSEGTEIQGFVVEFSSPSNFFVQGCNAKSLEKLIKVSKSLQNVYSNPENMKKVYTLEIGEICAAKYSQDQQWYRVLVHNLEMNMRTAQVLYLDYGNTETVKLDDLQPMHKDVELVPPSAINCCIAYAVAPPFGWSPECLIDVKRLLVGKQLSFRIVRVIQEDLQRYVVDVSIPDSGEHVHKIMLEKRYSFITPRGNDTRDETCETGPAVEKQPETSGRKHEQLGQNSPPLNSQIKSTSFSVGYCFEAVITVIHDPETFFCQQVQNAKLFAELMISMNKRCSTVPITQSFLPAPGEVCAAQFTEDNNWYRASVVKHMPDDSILVGYFDFGNAESLHVSRLRPIDPDMLSIPYQATQCCLAGVKPPSGMWTSEATHTLGVLTTNKIIAATVVSESNGILTVELIDDSITPIVVVSKHLIEAGLAVPDTSGCKSPSKTGDSLHGEISVQLKWAEIPLGQSTEVVVCMLQNPGEFFCHICNQTDLNSLNELNILLGKYCRQHISGDYNPVEEEVCGAFYTGDGNWYRAQVKDFTPDGATKILFLDYGNIEDLTVDKLCKIPSSFLELPFQAIFCSLAGVKPLGEKWNKESAEIFQKSVVGIKLQAKAVGHIKHCYSVELMASESAKVITDVLIAERVAVLDNSKIEGSAMGANLSPVQERGDNDSLQPHRDPLVTREIKIHTINNSSKKKVAVAHSESPSTMCTKSPPRELSSTKSTPSFQRELPSTNSTLSTAGELRSPNSASLTPRELQSSKFTPPADREFNSTNATPSFYTDLHPNNSISPARNELRSPNATLSTARELRSPNSASLTPRELQSSKFTPPADREFNSTNATPSFYTDLHPNNSTSPARNELRSANATLSTARESPSSSPSTPRDPRSSSSTPMIPRELRNTISTPPAHSELRSPNTTLPAPRESRSASPLTTRDPRCGSSTPIIPRELHNSNSSPPERNDLRLPNSYPSLPREPYSANSNPSTPREFQSTTPSAELHCMSSTPSAQRELHSDISSPANEQVPAIHGQMLSSNNSASKQSPAIQDSTGVCIARRWESVDLPLNEALPACVLSVISPDLFYVFPKENRVDVGKLNQVMMAILNYCCSEIGQHHYKPSVGDACCAKFTADGQWYRAVVLEVCESTAKIAYADYGNMESLPFSCLLPIKETFLNPPMQITKCSLSGVTPVSEQWMPEATETLSSILLGADVVITAQSVKAGIYSVCVEKMQETGVLRVDEKLVMYSLARYRTSMSGISGCADREGCCCRDLQKRVEKLELILLHLLKEEKMK